jgi:phospholipase C
MPRHLRLCEFSPSEADVHDGITRRNFLAGLAGLLGALAIGQLGCGGVSGSTGHGSADLPSPQSSGIEHVVLAMMENRSFDHLLGWMPNADGKQAGLSYSDGSASHPTFRLAPDFQGCGHRDPDHSFRGGRIEYNGGACNGWLLDGINDLFAIGYYTQDDLQFLGRAAPAWTVCDRYFAAIMAETVPNRLYQHAAQTDRLSDTNAGSTLPTIWDSLAQASVSGRYYFSSTSFLSHWGGKYDGISAPVSQFFADCAAGQLPSVAYVDPHFGGTAPAQNDDHPTADIRSGEAFLNSIYRAVTTSPNWPGTVLVISFDEWGGFFDHVPPPTGPIPQSDLAAGNTDGLLGFRVPCLLISPFARRGFVSSTVFDHTSVLSLIEWRWNLPSLTVRDQNANNLATALDLSRQDTSAPQFDVPAGPFGISCKPV